MDLEKERKGFETMHREMRPRFLAQKISGRRMEFPRDGGDPVEVHFYEPAVRGEAPLPAVFNMHGGAFIGGDAVLLDTFCRMLADRVPCAVFNVNYRKAPEYPFPYALGEVCDAVRFAAAHAEEFGIDVGRMAVCGSSAGGGLAAGAALRLREENGPALACQMLIYPCTDLSRPPEGPEASPADYDDWKRMESFYCPGDAENRWASPLLADESLLKGLCPAVFVTCGKDVLQHQAEAYAKKLIDCGVPAAVRRWAEAQHGFVEVNRPDYFFDDPRKTPEQAALARSAENFIAAQFKLHFSL